MKRALPFFLLLCAARALCQPSIDFVQVVHGGDNCLVGTSGWGVANDSENSIYLTKSHSPSDSLYFGNEIVAPSAVDVPSINFFISKSNSNGQFLWQRTVNGVGTNYAKDIAVDPQGNVYTTGVLNPSAGFDTTFVEAQGSENLFVSKHSTQGNLEWVMAFGSSYARGLRITTDATGILVAGAFTDSITLFDTTLYSVGPSGFFDVVLLKLNSDGEFTWLNHIGGQKAELLGDLIATDEGYFICGAYQVAISINGTTQNADNNSDLEYYLAALSLTGELVWLQNLKGSNLSPIMSLATDETSNVYLTGRYINTLTGNSWSVNSVGARDVFLAKYSSSGQLQWLKSYGGDATDIPQKMVFDSTTTSFVLGVNSSSPQISFGKQQFTNGTGGSNIFVVQLDTAGEALCSYQIPSSTLAELSDICIVDESTVISGVFQEDVSIIDQVYTSIGIQDAFVLKAMLPCDTITSIHKYQTSGLGIYPNPATTTVTITLPKTGAYTINVIDATGRVVSRSNLTAQTATLNTHNWPQGIYAITATGQDGARYTGRLVVGR